MAGKPSISLNGDELRQLYVVDGLTSRQIAARHGVGYKTIIRRLQGLGVEIRKPGPARHDVLADPQWLREQYEQQRKSLHQIASETGASTGVIRGWLKQHGIVRRPKNQHLGREWSEDVRQRMSEAKKGKHVGEANPNWRGGLIHPDKRLRSSMESRTWSRDVRERDGHKCVECGAEGRLHAHHVKPWRDHPELRFDLANGVTLCPPCHQKAHGWKFPTWAYHGENRTSAKHPE